MAYFQSAAQWIGKLLAEEAKYLAKVIENVKELQDELEWMQSFLRSVDASHVDNSLAKKWISQIKEFSYEAEDTVEKFVVNSRGGGGHGYFSILKKYSIMFWKPVALHEVGKDIDALRSKMSSLAAKLNTYGVKIEPGDSSLLWLWKAKHESYFTCKKEPCIGRETNVQELLKLLVPEKVNKVDSSQPSSSKTTVEFPILDSISESRVVSIWGVGGIGKTFVAKEIFHHHKIRRSYQAFAWASIYQPCQISAVQQELLSGLTSKSREQIVQMTDSEVKHQLCKVQRRKKCFIVLDGFSKAELWDQLKEAFPITCCDCKSTLLLTTRIDGVAKYVHDQAFNYPLPFLDPLQSKLLLEEKIRDSLAALPDYGKKKIYMEKMLKHSGGLPLAIVMLGGVLAMKRTQEEWKIVEEKLNLYLISEKEHRWERILNLSYNELPYLLKPCLLYLGYFPANMEIATTKLSRLWEAEGLVSSGDDEESHVTLEDIAERCLAELVERSLVQVAFRDLTGRAKTCKLHDGMRKLFIDKALKENWISIAQLYETRDENDQSSATSSSSLKLLRSTNNKRECRRLAIYCTENSSNVLSDYKEARYLRSLLFFNTLQTDTLLIPLKNKTLESVIYYYKFLRVLDIENTGLYSLPKDVGSLIHLRYLSLRGSWVSKIPYSIKHLQCLQTLDLRVFPFVRMRIPDVLSNLKRLVHLFLPYNVFILRNEVAKLQLKGLDNLETLSNFSNMCKADDLSTLTNLGEFSSCDYLSCPTSVEPLLRSPRSLVYLDYISLRLGGHLLSAYPLDMCKGLHKLWVKGNISQPISSLKLPHNLKKLSLSGSGFLEDPMPIFEKLPQLKHLSLENGSYNGTRMKCSKGGFQELCYLNVEGLEELEDWTVKLEAMPKLCTLEINGCHKLVMIPEGLRDVKSLQELIISYMPLSFYKGWTPLKSLTDWTEYSKVQHVPRIDILKILDIQKI